MTTPFKEVETESSADMVLWCRPGVTKSLNWTSDLRTYSYFHLLLFDLELGIMLPPGSVPGFLFSFKLSYNEWIIEQDIT